MPTRVDGESGAAPARKRSGPAASDGVAARALGARLKQARDALGLSVRDMGKLVGIPWGSIAAIERGRDARWSTLMRYLSHVPGLRAAELLPTPTLHPPPASHCVLAFMADACRLSAESLSVTLSMKRDGTAEIVRHLRGLRSPLQEGAWEPQAHRLMLAAYAGSRDALGRLEPPERRGRTVRLLDGAVTHEFRATTADGKACVDYLRRETLPESPAHPAVRLEVTLPVREVVLRVQAPARLDEACARPGAWLTTRTSNDATGGLLAWLQPAGIDLRQPKAGTLEWHVPDALPELTFELALLPAPPPPDVMLALSAGQPRTFAPLAQRVRRTYGLSTRALAQRLGVSHVTLGESERGRDVRASTLRKYVAALPELPPQVLLPAREPHRVVSSMEAWEYMRDLHRLEAVELRRMLVVRPNGDAEVAEDLLGLRSLGGDETTVQILLNTSRSVLQRAASVLEEIATDLGEDGESEMRARMVERRAGRSVHQVTVPGRLSRRGLRLSQRVRTPACFSLTEDEARARRSREGPFVTGSSIAVSLPVRRLSFGVQLPEEARFRDPWPVARPVAVLPDERPLDYLERIHPGSHAFRADADGRFQLTVEHPLCGFSYGIGWHLA